MNGQDEQRDHRHNQRDDLYDTAAQRTGNEGSGFLGDLNLRDGSGGLVGRGPTTPDEVIAGVLPVGFEAPIRDEYKRQAAKVNMDVVLALLQADPGTRWPAKVVGPWSLESGLATYDGMSHAISYRDAGTSETVIMTLSRNTSFRQVAELVRAVA